MRRVVVVSALVCGVLGIFLSRWFFIPIAVGVILLVYELVMRAISNSKLRELPKRLEGYRQKIEKGRQAPPRIDVESEIFRVQHEAATRIIDALQGYIPEIHEAWPHLRAAGAITAGKGIAELVSVLEEEARARNATTNRDDFARAGSGGLRLNPDQEAKSFTARSTLVLFQSMALRALAAERLTPHLDVVGEEISKMVGSLVREARYFSDLQDALVRNKAQSGLSDTTIGLTVALFLFRIQLARKKVDALYRVLAGTFAILQVAPPRPPSLEGMPSLG